MTLGLDNTDLFALLKQDLQQKLDALDGQYDNYIDIAIKRAILHCRQLLPGSFGRLKVKKLDLKALQTWYDVDIYNLSSFQEVKLVGSCGKEYKLQKLKIIEFLSLSDVIGVPRFYSNLGSDIGLNPVPNNDAMQIIIKYIGYNDDEFIKNAFDLIGSRALYEINKDITQDNLAAQRALHDFNEQIILHNLTLSRNVSTGVIKPTEF